MDRTEILGQEHIKKHLISSAITGRVPHAQLFVGFEGCGTLPMAIGYANLLLGKISDLSHTGDLSHPDLHFVYPNTSNDVVKKHPTSKQFLKEWRSFISENPYGSLFEWLNHLGVNNKQGQIGVDDALEVVKSLSLKSYQGGYKIMIIWMADKMNVEASNKLLKIIEEPPKQTVFILITNSEESIIQTIRSRCQVIRFNAISDAVITQALVDHEKLDVATAQQIAHQAQGNYNLAVHYTHQDSDDEQFEKWFIQWVRAAFKAKGNKSSILELISWSEEISALGRESQKRFLEYCTAMFRQALLINYQALPLVYMKPKTEGFKLEKLAPFVNGSNIEDIFKELSDAIYHISRNGNQKLILTDLSIKLTRLIHKK